MDFNLEYSNVLMKTYTIVVREINIDWEKIDDIIFEDSHKKSRGAFLEEHITEYLSVDMALKILQDNTTRRAFAVRLLP